MGTPEEHREAAERAMAEAEHLAGRKTMTDLEFLSSMAQSDSLIDHDPEECGMCCHMSIMAQVAREMIAAHETEDGTRVWSQRARQRWQESKFFKLWQEETAAGRDPKKAFAERGWEP